FFPRVGIRCRRCPPPRGSAPSAPSTLGCRISSTIRARPGWWRSSRPGGIPAPPPSRRQRWWSGTRPPRYRRHYWRAPAGGAGSPRGIGVPGATGFGGRRLVHELLTRTELTVVCLVRAVDDRAALDRVTSALTASGLWQPRFSDRLEAYAGDLSRPGLGLPGPVGQQPGRTPDLVLHNGALVNFLFDYRVHRPVNVLGTAEVLRLAMTHHIKPLHHISTLGVLDGEARRQTNPLSERFELTCGEMPLSGYSRSKW